MDQTCFLIDASIPINFGLVVIKKRVDDLWNIVFEAKNNSHTFN
ncbi:hypothetical protein [Flavobacterium muglaense]|nr:hypothetical protein [Flavobacterium muglaense]